jgi:hypothetical protein
VQIVWSSRKGSRKIEHLGSAHDEARLELLKAAAEQRLAANQQSLELGLDGPGSPGAPLEIVATRSAHLWEALCTAYRVLGFESAAGGDEVFRDLVGARIIEPTSKVDALQVLEETGWSPRPTAPSGVDCRSSPNLNSGKLFRLPARRTPSWVRPAWCFTT